MMKEPCSGVLVLGQAEFLGDDHLHRHGAPHRLLGGRGDRLVIGVGMQRVAVVVDGHQRLERGADIVEVHLLGVQRTARGLDMVLEFLAAVVGAVFLPHGDRPDAPGHAADDRVFGIQAVGEEVGEVGGEVVDVHAAREVILHEGETVGQREGQLRDRVGPRLGDMIAADGDRIVVAHLVFDEDTAGCRPSSSGRIRWRRCRCSVPGPL